MAESLFANNSVFVLLPVIKLLTTSLFLFPQIFSNYKDLDQLDNFISFAYFFGKWGMVVCF